jgi:hypothetical protein
VLDARLRSNTLSRLLEMPHSKQLRSIKMLIDSNHGIYRVGVRLGLAQQLRQEPRLRRNMLDQTRHPWRAPRGTRWGTSVL